MKKGISAAAEDPITFKKYYVFILSEEPINVCSSQRTRRLMLTLTPEGVMSSITDSNNSGAGSITTGGWWCELERENKQCETGVSYPTEVI